MVDPGQLGEATTVFVSGDDAGAKATVTELLTGLGHQDVIDLGRARDRARHRDAAAAVAADRWARSGTGMFNLKVVR